MASALAEEAVISEGFWSDCTGHTSLVAHQRYKRISVDLLGNSRFKADSMGLARTLDHEGKLTKCCRQEWAEVCSVYSKSHKRKAGLKKPNKLGDHFFGFHKGSDLSPTLVANWEQSLTGKRNLDHRFLAFKYVISMKWLTLMLYVTGESISGNLGQPEHAHE